MEQRTAVKFELFAGFEYEPEMRHCRHCGEDRLLAEFPKDQPDRRVGREGQTRRGTRCRTCIRARVAKPRAKIDSAATERTCSSCSETKPVAEFPLPQQHKTRPGEFIHFGQCRACCGQRSRDWGRRVKYGIDPERFDAMREQQDYRCASCGVHEDDVNRTFNVDHDHACCPGRTSCGRCVRALLCVSCNVGIGMFGDDPAKVEKALAYLRRHSPAADSSL